jgi:DNA-binding transcriptional regulator YdaS (Cro superfamily)
VTGIEKAVQAAGGQSNLARALGVKRQSVQQWVARGYPPTGRVVEISLLYVIPREELLDPMTLSLLNSPGFDEE